MKNLKFLSILIITFVLFGCGSASDYTKNNLSKNFYENKTIIFILNPNSIQDVPLSGTYTTTVFDDNKSLVVTEAFKESIEELAAETKFNLKFAENLSNVPSNSTVVNVEIKEASWHFGFSVATMKTNVNYKIQNDNRELAIEGIRKSGGGSRTNNFKKSLKNATYKFLKELEK